ncbi:DUF6923 family protein [Clostridium rectalis]|uniref:DUF6923 family protein n=1 Tax=Clostridium rectalis TaxID=2040295 RepID=UPI000F63B0A2|nr:SdrD B-like domain-containing protein [Clostridium rectalis]
MAATIRGVVFDDLNNNGTLNPGEPGIPNAYVVIRDPNGVCTTVQTNASGVYIFSNLNLAGNYTVYETAINPGATCPPTNFGQPAGFTNSSTFRTQTINVTQTQIDNNSTINGRNYGHDNPETFTCRPIGYQVAVPPSAANSEFVEVNLVTGKYNIINPDMGVRINPIAYNVLDNMIYGTIGTTNNLTRISRDGSRTNFGAITGLPNVFYTTGDIDNQGNLYIYINDTATFYQVDLNQNSATFGQVLNSVPITPISVSDWSWNPIDGQLYGVTFDGIAVRVNPFNGNVTNLTTVGVPGVSSYGATFIDASGTLYAINNATGRVYRIIISGNNATGERFSQAVPTSINDGAMCHNSLIEIDFGDAPDPTSGTGVDNYNTLLANNGPRHQIINQLTLGTQVTAENDAYANLTTDATGDDILQGIQDDGTTLPLTPLLVTDTTYSLTVDVVNNTGLPGNVYGWIDFNKNGVFQGNEATPVVVVPSDPGVQQVVLNFTVPVGVNLKPDHTFVRVRVTTDELINQNSSQTAEDTRSIGPASDGEVEDYYLQIDPVADIFVVKTADPDPVIPGEVLTYKIDVVNAGPSDAENVVLDDEVPPTIKAPEFSIDGGATFNPWPTIYDIGTLLAGKTITILIRGIVESFATGIISNVANVISSTPDPDLNNNTSIVFTQVNALADISVVKTASPNPVNQGETLTYTIDVINAGPADAQNVVLDDVIPPEIIGAEFSTDGGITFSPWPGSFDIGTLSNGETRTVLIRGTVSPSAIGIISNTAGVISSTPDPNLDNNMSTVDTEINTADISVIKTSDLNPAFPGEILTYTIKVSNAGPADAENVVLTDAIPPEIVGAEFSVDGGVTFNPWPGSFNIGTLLDGETSSILIRGTVAASAIGIISNTANVTSTTPDPNPDNNTSTVDIEVNALADISVIKTGSPNPVVSGETLTYTIDVSNFGPSLAEDVTLSDVIPPEITGAEFSTDGGITFNPWTGSFNLGTLLNDEIRTIIIRGTVAPVGPGFITNTVDVTSTTLDPNLSNNTSTAVIEVNESTQVADVGVYKSVDMNPITPEEMVVYSIKVSNFGPADAQNVILTDNIPPEITGAEFSTDGGANFNPWPGSLDIGTLLSGETRNILIRGTVSPLVTGIISNTAEVSSATQDPNPSNNTSTVDVEVVPSADVSITKTSAPNPVIPGEILTYTINVFNAGPSNAQDVVLMDFISSDIIGAEFSIDGGANFDPWSGSFDIGTILAGETKTILIRGTVSQSATGTISNTANITSSTPDPDLDNNETTVDTEVNALADISVIKTGTPNPVVTGEILTYTIDVSNAGPADAQNVVLDDAISPDIIGAEFSIDGGANFNPWTTIYIIGTLPAGETRTILIRGTVSPSSIGTISNTASVISSTPDPDLDNNETTVGTGVNALADISVIKTGIPNPVLTGEILTYTIDVSNAGPADAQNVVLDDAIPPDIIGAEFSIDGGVTFNPWPIIYIIGTIPASETKTILIRGTVSPSATGIITNNAAVISSTPDPDLDNNETTVDTEVNALADISVIKIGSPNPVVTGEILTYKIVVSNTGPADAENVVLMDIIPPEIIRPEFSINGGVTFNPWTGSVVIGTLKVMSSRTILIRGKVVSSDTKCKCTTNIINTAKVMSTTPDPNLNNNTSIATIKTSRYFMVCSKNSCCNKCNIDCYNKD